MSSRRRCPDRTCGYGCSNLGCFLARLDPPEVFIPIESPELQREVKRGLRAATDIINRRLDAVKDHFANELPGCKLAFLENDRGRIALGFVLVKGPETDIELDNPPSDIENLP
jgi:hypothetical protein